MFFISIIYICLFIYNFNKIIFFDKIYLRNDRFGFYNKSSKFYINRVYISIYIYTCYVIIVNFYLLFYDFLLFFGLNFGIISLKYVYIYMLLQLFLTSLLFNFYRYKIAMYYDFNHSLSFFFIFFLTFFIFLKYNFCIICLFLFLLFCEVINMCLIGRNFIEKNKYYNFFVKKKNK
jgi:hypothetical protein